MPRKALPTNLTPDQTDEQTPPSGKVANASNKVGNQPPTQRNEGRRTPPSRHDRESHAGSHNQTQVRRGGPGSGAPKKGGG